MRPTMLSRYLGNKTNLLDPLLAAVSEHAPPGGRVCDIFAGTLSVALECKRQGYNVIANDVNYFSFAIGEAFLKNQSVPEIALYSLIPPKNIDCCFQLAIDKAAVLEAQESFSFLRYPQHREPYVRFLALLEFLQQVTASDLPESARHSYIYDTYCEEGRNSAFRSLRGSVGNRRFFSSSNARHIDAILNQLRLWFQCNQLSCGAYYLILAVLIRAVEKVSNTQGTYHDFPRENIDPRALSPLQLDPPPMDIALVGGDHIVRQGDSLKVIEDLPAHDVLYIDPPYNFRQYTSYYFMPNLICRYPEIEDLEGYFSAVEFVRGQNMVDDFDSTFCKKSKFIDSLSLLIRKAKTQTVILSYFDGRNHWSDFKSPGDQIGLGMLCELFESPLFEPGSLVVKPVSRLNYQSYGGFKATEVKEYIIVAKKTGEKNK